MRLVGRGVLYRCIIGNERKKGTYMMRYKNMRVANVRHGMDNSLLGLINYFQEKVSFVLYFFLVVILGVCWIFLYYASKNVVLCNVIVSEWYE